MRKITNYLFAAALAFSTVFAATPQQSNAQFQDWYVVNNPFKASDVHGSGHVALFDTAGGRPARIQCKVPHGQYLQATGDFEENGWIKMRWRKKLGNFEWDYKGYRSGYCPHWKRVGWAWNGWVRKVPKPHGPFVH